MNQFSIKPTGDRTPYNHTVPSGRYITRRESGNRDHGYTIDSSFHGDYKVMNKDHAIFAKT